MLDGAAPKNEPIRMNADPVCVKQKRGAASSRRPTSSAATASRSATSSSTSRTASATTSSTRPTETAKIDQKDCRYHPHVFGMRVGQPLEIINSDPTLHNIHAMPKANKEFNTGQPIQGMKTTHTFDGKEVMVPFKCDVHGWMNAYVGVLDHPYFAVTGEDGKFELKTLPPGTYTIEAWHEKLGAQHPERHARAEGNARKSRSRSRRRPDD